jgi:hypothetical protein
VAGSQRFAYYDRLSAKEQETYKKSDAIARIPLPDADALRPLVSRLDEALATGKRARVAAAATALAAALMKQLEVVGPKIHVREVRPQLDDGELHGLYTFAQDGKPPKLEVWMRTAAHSKVVRFRTFLRTLVHELAHHLDVTLFALEDSFHTEGFFRRESSLVRQLAPRSEERDGAATPAEKTAARTKKKPAGGKRPHRPFVQLELF